MLGSHDKNHSQFVFTLGVLQTDSFRDDRFLVGVLLGHIVKSLLEFFHPEKIAPVSKVDLELFHVVHHIQETFDKHLDSLMKLMDFVGN